MNYASYVMRLAYAAGAAKTDAPFTVLIPAAIDYAEQRIYRELDLLQTVTRDSHAIAAQNRDFNVFSTQGATFITTLGFNVITPVPNVPDGGIRNPLVPTTRDFLDMAWPDGQIAHCALPRYYAMITQTSIIVGPWPDQAYEIEIIGTVRPAPLSASNTTTFLTQYLPDMFLAASMVFVAGWMKESGAQNANPESWEAQYEKLFASANVEEQRKKYASGAWGSLQPTPLATPNR